VADAEAPRKTPFQGPQDAAAERSGTAIGLPALTRSFGGSFSFGTDGMIEGTWESLGPNGASSCPLIAPTADRVNISIPVSTARPISWLRNCLAFCEQGACSRIADCAILSALYLSKLF